MKSGARKAYVVRACFLGLILCLALVLPPAGAQTDTAPGSRWQRLRQTQEAQRENRQAVVSQESLGAITANIREAVFFGAASLIASRRSSNVLPSHSER